MTPSDQMWYNAGVRAFVTRRYPIVSNGESRRGYFAAEANAADLGLKHVRVDALRPGDEVVAVFARRMRKFTVRHMTMLYAGDLTQPGGGVVRKITLRFKEDERLTSSRAPSACVLLAPKKPRKVKLRGDGPFTWLFKRAR